MADSSAPEAGIPGGSTGPQGESDTAGAATSGGGQASAGSSKPGGLGSAGAAADTMRQAGGRILGSGSAIGAKVIDQAEQNAREAFGAMRAAAEAKDLSEVMRIQADFLREQGNRSMTQAREIGELILQFGRDAVTPLKPR